MNPLKLAAAILGPRRFIVARIGWLFRSLAAGGHAFTHDAVLHNIIANRGGAPLPEREIVFRGPTLIAMPDDPDFIFLMFLKEFEIIVDAIQLVRAKFGAVEIEIDFV